MKNNRLRMKEVSFVLFIIIVLFMGIGVGVCSAQYISTKSYTFICNDTSSNSMPEHIIGGETVSLTYNVVLATEAVNYRYVTLHSEMEPLPGENLWLVEENLKIPETDVNKQRTIIRCIQNQEVVIGIKGKYPIPNREEPKDVLSLGLTSDPAKTERTLDTIKVTVTSEQIERVKKMIEEVKGFIDELKEKENNDYNWVITFYEDYKSLAERKLDGGTPWVSEEILHILLNKKENLKPIMTPTLIDILMGNRGVQAIITVLVILLLLACYHIRTKSKEGG